MKHTAGHSEDKREPTPERSRNEMQLIVVTGLSGSGKSSALNVLEDAGFFCIDNLPIVLLPELIRNLAPAFANDFSKPRRNIAVGIDARNTDQRFRDLPSVLNEYSPEWMKSEIVYLETDQKVLLTRFSETRRRHPLSDDETSLEEAIQKEVDQLAPLRRIASHIINSSSMSLHELKRVVKQRIVKSAGSGLEITIKSFGFKYSTPTDCDFLFDVRCLSNPYWEPSLRAYSGKDKPVIQFLDKQDDVQTMHSDIVSFLKKWLPAFQHNNRSYLTVGIGCTGGRHRSVYLSEKVAQSLRSDFDNVRCEHRESKDP